MQYDVGIITTLIATTLGSVGAILAMMFWCRQEANSLRADAKEDRKDLMQISRNLEIAISNIQNEMKDFHQRLISIEKERKI